MRKPSPAIPGCSTAVAAPVNTALPVISGTPQSGQTLTSSTGTWQNSPTSYGYLWSRCNATCTPIGGATAASYQPTDSDVGAKLQVTVTASNSGGSTPATSALTGSVQRRGPEVINGETTTHYTFNVGRDKAERGRERRFVGKNGVRRQLFLHEPRVRLVVVERVDQVVAIRPRIQPGAIHAEAVRLAIVHHVEPVPRPALAITRRRQ